MNDNSKTSCCSSCGKQENITTRGVNCISETKYWAGGGGNYVNFDNEVNWKVSLCENCMPKARNIYIQNQLMSGLKKIGIGILAIAGAGALFMVAYWTDMFGEMGKSSGLIESMISGPKTFLNLMYMGLMIIIFVTGMGLIPYGIIISITNRIRKSVYASNNNVNSSWINKCVIGESERILECLESNDKNTSPVFGEFVLPLFKEASELKGEERKKAKELQDSVQWKKRRILHDSVN